MSGIRSLNKFQFYLLKVLSLKSAYKGQNEIMEVSRKTIAKTSKMMPKAPVTIPAKYR